MFSEKSFFSIVTKIAKQYSADPFFINGDDDTQVSYGEFYNDCLNYSSYLTNHLKDYKVILLPGRNSYLFAVGLMSIILSGKTLLPFSSLEDEENIKLMRAKISDSNIILSEAEQNLALKSKAAKNYRPFETWENEDFIYIPTSASTGVSKLVVQSEKALFSNIESLISHHELYKRKVIATPLPLFHVNALHFSFLSSFFSGGKIVLFSQLDLRRQLEAINKYSVNIMSVIPPLLNSLIQNKEQLKGINISALDYFVSAASPLSVETVQSIQDIFHKNIIQGYGLSEGINFSCTLPVDLKYEDYRSLMLLEKYPSVGIALTCNKILIKNAEGLLCNEGQEGELFIAGKNVFRSYLGHEKLISEWFPTGDLAYYKTLKEQKFYFISGRLKEIAKVNGVTVPLRDIDEKIYRNKKIVNDCISTSFENNFKGEQLALICHVLPDDQIDEIFESLKLTFLSMGDFIPKVILFTRENNLRTPSGKARRWYFKNELEEYKNVRFTNNFLKKILR
jgi:acyl-CoA synthetase (AMP-forming)/AMP-acid ligase II